MKIKYFAYMAEQAFRTLPTGERVFFYGVWRSHPYLLPDEATEKRLFKKNLWFYRLALGGLILGQPFLFTFIIGPLQNILVWVGYFAGMMLLFTAIYWLTFRNDIRGLQKASGPTPGWSFWFRDTLQRTSWGYVLFGMGGSLALFVGSVWMFWDGFSFWSIDRQVLGGIVPYRTDFLFLGAFCAVFFGGLTLLWFYGVYVKIRTSRTDNAQPKPSGNKE